MNFVTYDVLKEHTHLQSSAGAAQALAAIETVAELIESLLQVAIPGGAPFDCAEDGVFVSEMDERQ